MSWIPEIGLLGNTLRNQLKSMKMKSILHHSWLMDLLVWSLFNLSDKNWSYISHFLQMKNKKYKENNLKNENQTTDLDKQNQ